ncbi:hypothetical protein QTQ03_07515 [Micromonospora sp. WMMA1363]|uniref:hypothetical protein n=1 Tax=Micromonospora sp. WMMA1363 TaxID=3053985 RepID=UPI00259CE2A5|nr:hypothetical protein [Micromonospora sp. WMMA1363]MDM4719453.1 hypothetical protein [Micromonospora sp. WMMA1363]
MTRWLVLPPLFDLSLEPVLEPGDHVLDLNADFVDRRTGTANLRALSTTYDRHRPGTEAAERATKSLFVRAAASIMSRGAYDWGRLRAIGLALRLSAETDPAIRLAVDDVEIVDGTTESAADVVSAATRTALFTPEVDRVRGWAPGARVHLLVETDQQLPAAAALVGALGADRVVLCGRFAAAHRAALRARQPFAAADFEDWAPSWRLRREWVPDGGTPRWVRRAADWHPGGPWAGWLEPAQAALLPARAWRDCRGVTLTVARLSTWSAVTGTDGTRTDLEPVRAVAGDDRLAVELLVGCPGMAAAATGTTARRLLSEPGPRLAGLSPFRLRATDGQPYEQWDGVPLTRLVSPEHDLPRWDRFRTPGTLGDVDRHLAVSALTAELSAGSDLYPGRLACCVLARRNQPPPMWEPSAAVVAEDGPGPDGRGPGTFVANLRTGGAFRLHPKLTPVVDRLATGDAGVWNHLSDTVRTKLSGQLIRAGVIRRTQ